MTAPVVRECERRDSNPHALRHRNLNPTPENHKSKSDNGLSLATPPVTAQGQRTASNLPPDLALVIDRWADLPEALRSGIVAMVRASLQAPDDSANGGRPRKRGGPVTETCHYCDRCCRLIDSGRAVVIIEAGASPPSWPTCPALGRPHDRPEWRLSGRLGRVAGESLPGRSRRRGSDDRHLGGHKLRDPPLRSPERFRPPR